MDPATLSYEDLMKIRDKIPSNRRAEFDSMVVVARARKDRIEYMNYVIKDDKGKAIKLSKLQQLETRFIEAVWKAGYTPMVFASMSSGKSTLLLGFASFEIGEDQNTRVQIICSNDLNAVKRGRTLKTIIKSPHFLQVNPHIKAAEPWSDHEQMVERSGEAAAQLEQLKQQALWDSTGVATSIDPTVSLFGIDSGSLGSRVKLQLFDDIATPENSIESPSTGQAISAKLSTKWESREQLPMGMTDEEYEVAGDPSKSLFIGTPWAETDPIYGRRHEPGYCYMVAGVNSDFTGYNVQMWGVDRELGEYFKNEFGIGEGEVTDQDDVPVVAFTVSFEGGTPAAWYRKKHKKNPAEFDMMYRCYVKAKTDKAFPSFNKTLESQNGIYLVGAKEHPVDWSVNRVPVIIRREGSTKDERIGWRSYVTRPPSGVYKIMNLDFAGVRRQGTVLMVGIMLENYVRVPIDIMTVAATSGEISDLISEMYADHPGIAEIRPERAGLQDPEEEWRKHKEKYPWWMKLKPFTETRVSKNDQQVGVLSLDTVFANKGILIADSTACGHPTIGSREFPRGCPCGFCRLIRDARNQAREQEISSDLLMTLWMQHLSFPNVFELYNGEGMEPYGFDYAKSGIDLLQPHKPGPIGEELFGQSKGLPGQEPIELPVVKCLTCGEGVIDKLSGGCELCGSVFSDFDSQRRFPGNW